MLFLDVVASIAEMMVAANAIKVGQKMPHISVTFKT